jgi:predicted MPP superfamily phosphohydrolase
MFHVVTGIIGLFIIWRFVLPLRWSRPGKVLLAGVVLMAAEHHLVTRTFFGTMASPEVPSVVLIVLGWAFSTLILLALFLLAKDLLGVLSYPLSRKLSTTLLTAPRLRLGLGAAAVLLSALGVWQAVRVPDVKTIEITLPRLPPALDGFRLVHLTDLHASRLMRAPWVEAVVARANALEPDLTVITGDLIDGTPAARVADVRPLKDLRARHGVIAIPGNHDYYSEYLGWLPAFEQLGLRMLFNEHVTVTHNGRGLVLAGVTDIVASRIGQPLPNIVAALEKAPKSDPVILLSHRPLGAVRHSQAGVDLQLSGHTHGGQILGLHMVTAWANEGFVSGLYRVGDMQLYVSNGAGLWAGFPVRLGRPSEITQIVLRSGAGALPSAAARAP